jgi:mRNA-degrading endonuclease RelE of RelBE toxin-antitoxin system
MTWIVHIHDGAAKQLKEIPPDRRQRVLDDIEEFEADPFRGLVKPLKGKEHKGRYRKVSGRYRTIFKPVHSACTVEVLAVLLRNEKTIDDRNAVWPLHA